MPGRFFLTMPLTEVAAQYDATLNAEDPGPRLDAAPGEQVAALTTDGEGLSLSDMRWGMVMSGRVNARGRPVMETIVNARSETLFTKTAFEGVRRAVLPVEGWYEWTGKARRKTRWRMRPSAGGLLAFAAIWDVWNGPGGIEVPQLASVTVPPNPDVADYHHRMAAILAPGDIHAWLTAEEDAARDLLQPAPKGTITVEEAIDVQARLGH